MEDLRILRADAGWLDDTLLAEAMLETPSGGTLYAGLTDTDGRRALRIVKESEYDNAFVKTVPEEPSEDTLLWSFSSIRESAEVSRNAAIAFGALDDLADRKDLILEYHWLPGEEEDPFGFGRAAGVQPDAE